MRKLATNAIGGKPVGRGRSRTHGGSSEASYGWLPSMAFVERHRGQVPLNFDEGGFNVRRFATRAWACGERVRYPTIFQKSLIRYLMTGDGTDAASESNGNLFTLPSREEENDEVVNRGKPGLVEMLESLFALADYRPSLSTLTFEGGDLHWRLLH